MRVKIRAGRAKPIKRPSLKLSSPSTPLLPSFNQVEAGKDEIVPDTYSDSDIGIQHSDAAPGTSAKVIRKSCNRDAEGVHKEFMDVNWLEKRSCLKCCGTGEMLDCAETGCPIVIHEKCLSCKPIIDKSGNFYCPYCSYKRAVAEYQDKRRKFMLHKTSFTNFLKTKAAVGDQVQEENGIAAEKENASSIGIESEKQGANDSTARNAVLKHQSKRLNQSPVKTKLGISEAVQEEDSREAGNDLSNVVADEHLAKVSDSGHEEDGIAAVEETTPSIRRKKQGANDSAARNVVLQHQSKRHVKRKFKIDNDVQEENSREVDDDLSDLVVDERQTQAEASDAGHEEEREVMDCTDETSEDGEEMEHVSPKKPSPKPAAPAGKVLRRVKTVAVKKPKKSMKKVKRRRLIWAAEEEEMLKEGVKKFERKNRNLPWRKILELGHEVFDQTRTPSDLKDKWKNMVARNLWQS